MKNLSVERINFIKVLLFFVFSQAAMSFVFFGFYFYGLLSEPFQRIFFVAQVLFFMLLGFGLLYVSQMKLFKRD